MILSIFMFLLGVATIIILLMFFMRMTLEGLFGILVDIKRPVVRLSKMEKQLVGILKRSSF